MKETGNYAGLFSIGHSNLPFERFAALLHRHGVERLVDIRSIPRSRYNPQFNDSALAQSLPHAGIEYAAIRELGGRRQARADSINTGFHPGGFRGYADYMQTAPFAAALERLIDMGCGKRTAYMCAEADPRQCHRLLVSDALAVRGIGAVHILSSGEGEPHRLTPLARIEGGRLFYPPEQQLLL